MRSARPTILIGSLVACTFAAQAQTPHARHQLQDFLYSIDSQSSRELGPPFLLETGDILTQGFPRDGVPNQVLDRTLHGLNSPNDQIDGLSSTDTFPPLGPSGLHGNTGAFFSIENMPAWLTPLDHDPLETPGGASGGPGPRGFSNDYCMGATPVPLGVPIFDTTTGMNNDFPPDCGPLYPDSPGVWFSVVGNGKTLTATTCTPARTFDTVMMVFCGPCGQLCCVGENDDAGGACGQGSTLSWCSQAGKLYYILVFGFGHNVTGNFELLVTTNGITCTNYPYCPPCALACTPNEPEPVCSDGTVDTFNGGCNSSPPVFTPIVCGQQVCGTAGNFLTGGLHTRDTDWYLLSLSVPTAITWTVTAEFPVVIGFVAQPCPQTAFYGTPAVGTPCGTVSTTQSLPAGNWVLFVAPLLFDGVPCGSHYTANVSCASVPHFAMLFSIDRTSVGLRDPDPSLVALGLPFNAKDQARKQQAAGDVFVSLLDFTRSGPIFPPGRSVSRNNSQVWNQGDSGGGDTELNPSGASPEEFVVPPVSGIAAGMKGEPARGFAPFFFSLSNSSPTLTPVFQGQFHGATIYIDDLPNVAGGERVYAQAADLGLQQFNASQTDDIDGLIVFDDGDGVFQAGVDQVLFTLTRTSITLSLMNLSAADILTTTGPGTVSVFCHAADLGLNFDPINMTTDHITMLDWVPCNDILTCVLDWGIGYVCTIPGCAGDCNGDCLVDLSDLAIVLSHFGLLSRPHATRAFGDINSDGVVDLSDLALLLASFGSDCDPS